ncbi:MAG: hypothetical protein AAGA11_06080 [Pseudomonadota bacterium]
MTSDDKPKGKLIKLNGRASRGRTRRSPPQASPTTPTGLRPADDLRVALGIDANGKVTPLRNRQSTGKRDRSAPPEHHGAATRNVVRLHPTPEPPLQFPRVNHRILRDDRADLPRQRTQGAGVHTRPVNRTASADTPTRPVPPFAGRSRGPAAQPAANTTDYTSVRRALATPVTLDRWTHWFKLLCIGIVLLLTLLAVSAL